MSTKQVKKKNFNIKCTSLQQLKNVLKIKNKKYKETMSF